ncbi:MAG: hypothetical protein ACK5JJ_03485 [Cyanobacteriota bacterium]
MADHLTSRAQRLLDEFEEGRDARHGIAKVLAYLADIYSDEESCYAVPASELLKLSSELTAPTLLDRALAGDRAAAFQFLRELGLIDEHGQLTGPYRPEGADG